MVKKTEKIFIVLSILFLGLMAAQSALALLEPNKLETTFPNLPTAEAPTTVKTLLPQVVNYFFLLAVFIVGLAILVSFVQAGVRYITSLDNPAMRNDSKDQLGSAILGGALLLGSYILLSTLNPQLITMVQLGLTTQSRSIIVYSEVSQGNKPQGNSAVLTASDPKLTSLPASCGTDCGARSLVFNNTNSREVRVYVYPDINYGGTPREMTWTGTGTSGPLDLTSPDMTAKSIKIEWRLPGIYLFDQTSYQGNMRYYTYSMASLRDFNAKAQSMKIISPEPSDGPRYGVILHEKANFQGRCVIVSSRNLANLDSSGGGGGSSGFGGGDDDGGGDIDVGSGTVIGNNTVSSITVFRPDPARTSASADTDGVWLMGSADIIDATSQSDPKHYVYKKLAVVNLDKIKSINSKTFALGGRFMNDSLDALTINGNWLVALFNDNNFEGNCEVFTQGDGNLYDNPIGRCSHPGNDRIVSCNGIGILNWYPKCLGPCTSSAVVVPTANP